MTNNKIKLKNLIKSFQLRVNKIKYKMSSDGQKIAYINYSGKTNNNENSKPIKKFKEKTFGQICLRIFHTFILLLVRIICRFCYGKKGDSMPPIKDLTLLESATSLAHKIRTKKLKSVDVMKSYIERIIEVNPLLNCVVDHRFEEAHKEALEADNLIESGKFTEEELKNLKPFLGVPFSTKDCIKVKGMLNTSGLWLRRKIRGDSDADSITLMRNAGAIPFALTNVSEVCMWWESSNTVHGRTNNAYDTNRIVGGSSGGEGCMQSAAMSPFGIGSDIGGSIRMPAFFNGIFGHKPSRNIVSNQGQFPEPFSAEQNAFLGIGPMCRYACDLKPVLKVISGDNAKLLKLDVPVDLSQINFFYQEDDGGAKLVSSVDPDLRSSLRKVIKHLENSLKIQPKRVQFIKFQQSASIWFSNMKDDSGKNFEYQLGNLSDCVNPYIEFLKWFVGLSKHTFVGLLTAIVDKTQAQYGSPKYRYLVNKRDELLKEIKHLLGNDGVLIYPTHPTVAPYHNEPIARTLNFSYTAIVNCLGLPSTAVPLGLGSEGLPLGVQVIANHNQDRLCLAVACELERAFGGWVAPEIQA